MKVTRIAPTPNGHYHLGNIYNFLYTTWWARKNLAHLFLRIDDHDPLRSKDKYIAEAIEILNLFEIEYEGPQSLEEFKKTYSQQLKTEIYWEKLNGFSMKFVCECSRKDIGDKPYDGRCINKKLEYKPGEIAIRFNSSKFDYPILWRKENIPSYQWASLIDDLDMKTTHLIRGSDLKESTLIQQDLAKALGVNFVNNENCYHHPLLKEGEHKLSKSRKSAQVIEDLRKPDSRRDIVRNFSRFALGHEYDTLEQIFKQGFPLKSNS